MLNVMMQYGPFSEEVGLLTTSDDKKLWFNRNWVISNGFFIYKGFLFIFKLHFEIFVHTRTLLVVSMKCEKASAGGMIGSGAHPYQMLRKKKTISLTVKSKLKKYNKLSKVISSPLHLRVMMSISDCKRSVNTLISWNF